jgi:glycosyltransferase involved in cell wall biosynthesis
MPKVSVVISTYRRLKNLPAILTAWLMQTNDVWLADSSGKFETSLAIRHVRFSPDPGNIARHALALLTEGDYVIKADDDVFPKPGLVEAFLNYSNLDGILGLMGRTFHGPLYYGNTKVIRAREISKPAKVDMVGIVTFSPRKYLAFDLRGCLTSVEDLYWHMKIYPHIKKYAIPTKAYEQLPESNDARCLFKSTTARREREAFYQKYYRMNY